jgi:WD40 repeat protein
MITTEDRARAAMRAIGDAVRDAPPLELTPSGRDLPAAGDELQFGGHGARRVSLRRPGGAARPGSRGRDRRWRSRLAPIAAAVAVAAVAITLVTIKDVPNGRVASPAPSTTSAGPADKNVSIPGVPEYYVAWVQADRPYLVVGDTATGKQVGEVAALDNVDLEGIYGTAADDRTFIVVGDRLFGAPNEGRAVFYLLRIGPGGRTPTLTRVSTPPQQNPAGIAISPDGTELAVAEAGSPATVRIYSIATGQVLRTWAATVPGALAVESASTAGGSSQSTAARVLRWSSDGRQLAFAWNSTAIRVLDVSAPDGNLITSSSVLAAIGTTVNKHSSITCNASQGWQLIADGRGVICAGSVHADGRPTSVGSGGACTYSGRTSIGFLEETKGGQGSAPTSLVDFEPECSAKAPDDAYIGWANADGSVVIGSLVWDGHVRFGLFRDGRFTALPALPVSVPVTTGVLIGTYDW